MRTSAAAGCAPARLLLLLLAAAASVSAVALPSSPSDAPARYLAIPVESTSGRPVRKRDSPEWISLIRRTDNAIGISLQNDDSYYSTTVSLGTPPQPVSVIVDTGSSELWVDPDCAKAPSSDEQDVCDKAGKYDPASSTTPPVGPFGGATINYGDPTDPSTQTGVELVYYTDVLTLGSSVHVTNQTFGVVKSSSGLFQGILGLAPDLQDGFAPGEPYSYVLNTLADQDVIPSRVFSLDLRHATDTTGAIIYGGYDKNRFAGTLVSRPLVRGLSKEFRLAVDLTGVSVSGAGGRSGSQDITFTSPAPALLDSGTTLTRLDSDTTSRIADALGAQLDPTGTGYYVMDCSTRSQSGISVDFKFGSATVSVPMADFVLDIGPEKSSQSCYLGITETEDLAVMGDSVLRAGYFVFDWDNEKVHIAQAGTCGSGADVAVVGTGSDSVPAATGNCALGVDTAANGPGQEGGGPTTGSGGRMVWGLFLAAGLMAVLA